MTWYIKLKKWFEESLGLKNLLKVLCIFLIVYLFSLTSNIWAKFFKLSLKVLMPFIIGFFMAYVIHPLIKKLNNRGISEKISIPLVIILILLAFLALLFSVLPMLYTRISSFINSLIYSLDFIVETYLDISDNPSIFIQNIIIEIRNILFNYQKWLPNLSSLLPSLVNGLLKVITNGIFAIVVCIYALFDFNKIKNILINFSNIIYDKGSKYLLAINEDVSEYIHSLFALMIIKFIEYALLYLLIGHRDWLIIALLTSLGLLVPYFGATIANVIGIFTSLSLPLFNTIILVIGICLLSMIDAYLIAPFVHNKNSQVHPIITLFCIFLGGNFFGALGIMFAIPVYISIRTIIRLFKQDNKEYI